MGAACRPHRGSIRVVEVRMCRGKNKLKRTVDRKRAWYGAIHSHTERKAGNCLITEDEI
jgi:uncharacterized protein (UPF0179 family)